MQFFSNVIIQSNFFLFFFFWHAQVHPFLKYDYIDIAALDWQYHSFDTSLDTEYTYIPLTRAVFQFASNI